MRPIIGFGHRSRVGKDTCSKFLNTELRMAGIKTAHVSFAWKLKEVCHDLYGWAGMKPPIHYENFPADRQIKLPAIGKTPVEIWVEVGNKLREVYPLTWIQVALRGQKNVDVVIVSDVRYQNEVDAIREIGGVVYKVVKPDAPVLDTVADNALEGYTGWDGVIENIGTLNDLYPKVKAIAIERLNEAR
jgi:hypothetical protein